MEGNGDATAVSSLVGRLLTEAGAWDYLFLDPHPFNARSLGKLLKDDCGNWIRWLGAAAKHRDIGAVLLVLDGDTKRIQGEAFCAANAAKKLAREAKHARGGELFSVAVVFACQEFESWLIAGVESLAGKPLKDGRPGVKAGIAPPDKNLEAAPRDAKRWLRKATVSGYSPARDQAALAKIVDLDLIRNRPMRSFRRLENALSQIVSAIRDESPRTSPS
ncbi:MAG: DUF4276 family protein [Candidatus Nealsonbacteria bacterium]|nr:DUF4276 family protein [Candidatus Nealsonbacteria bacterium]